MIIKARLPLCVSLSHTIGPFLLPSAVGVCCFFSLKKQSAENLFISFPFWMQVCSFPPTFQHPTLYYFYCCCCCVFYRPGGLSCPRFLYLLLLLSFFFFYYFCLVSVLIPCMSCCVFPVATAHFNGATDPFVCEYLKDFYLRTRFLYLSPLFIYSYAKLIFKSFKS